VLLERYESLTRDKVGTGRLAFGMLRHIDLVASEYERARSLIGDAKRRVALDIPSEQCVRQHENREQRVLSALTTLKTLLS
jgi:hypothetical protein